MRWPAIAILALSLSSGANPADQRQDYQSQESFVRAAFQGSPPPPRVLWLRGDLSTRLKNVLGHEPDRLRLHYWQKKARSVWILDEIGKTRPITTGVVIENDKILRLKVLTFRESRGWQIKHAFFTRQFTHLGLAPNGQLDQPIDGITGATLSVNAMVRVARAALVLSRAIKK